MGRYGAELRGQHGDSVKHVLLWAYSCVPHAGYSHIFLESLILLGLGAGLELRKGFVGLLFKIHSCQFFLHIHCIMKIFLSTFSTDYLLEFRIGDT